jgi:hypothetical protein
MARSLASATGNVNLNDILNEALRLADNGIPVFPVGANKMPVWSLQELGLQRGEGGLNMATTDEERIRFLFGNKKTTGIGMPTGKASDVTVIDVDCGRGKKNAEAAKAWLGQNRDKLRGATVVRTQSGGLHYYCKYTPGIMSAGNVWAEGVDCRNDGGYVVVPPFMGYSYGRQIDRDDWPDPPPVPEKKKSTADAKPHEVSPDVRAMIETLRLAQGDNQGWHTAMVRLTAHLVGSGWGDAEILRHVPQWTTSGYTHRETFEEVCIAITGMRVKVAKEQEPETGEQARLDKMGDLWNRMSPEGRKVFLQAVRDE